MYSRRRFLRDGVGLIKNLENGDTATPPPNLALARDMLRAPCLRAPENNWAILRNYGPKATDPVRASQGDVEARGRIQTTGPLLGWRRHHIARK
jgi:hypothetical protein